MANIFDFRFGILEQLFHDFDLDLSLYLNNNEIQFSKSAPLGLSLDKKEEKRDLKILPMEETVLVDFLNGKINFSKINDYFININQFNKIADFQISKGEKLKELSLFRTNWSIKLIEQYINDWDWYYLSQNSFIRWDFQTIDKFKNQIDFFRLSFNINLHLKIPDLYKLHTYFDMNIISGNGFLLNNSLDSSGLTDFPYAKWTSINKYGPFLEGMSFPIENLNENFERATSSEIKPSICTNPNISWTIELVEKNISKVDFWLIALYGKIDFDTLKKYRHKFNENRQISIQYTKMSDCTDEYPIFRNGWENYMRNSNTKITKEFIDEFGNFEIDVIKYDGDARNGHNKREITVKLLDIIPPNKLFLDFDELINCAKDLPAHYINPYHISNEIYFNIIKPHFLVEKNLLDFFQLLKYRNYSNIRWVKGRVYTSYPQYSIEGKGGNQMLNPSVNSYFFESISNKITICIKHNFKVQIRKAGYSNEKRILFHPYFICTDNLKKEVFIIGFIEIDTNGAGNYFSIIKMNEIEEVQLTEKLFEKVDFDKKLVSAFLIKSP